MVDSITPHEAIRKAVDALGSQGALAEQIGLSTTSVWKMVNNARRASAEYVLAIEAATGVSRHDLRPDLYPREDPPAHPSAPPPSHGADGHRDTQRSGSLEQAR